MSRKIGLRWFDYAGLAFVVLLASVLIAREAAARGILGMDLLWFLWR